MREIKPEEIYQEWLKQYNLTQNRGYKKIQNFDKIREKDCWIHFVKFCNLVNRNDGSIDYKIWLAALFKHYNGFFPYNNLHKRSSIKIYRDFISNNDENIKIKILKSIKFVVNYCKENDVKCFDDYLELNKYLFPDILKHFNAGSITIEFLACISNINLILNDFPQDFVMEFCSEVCENNFEKLKKVRLKIQCDEELLKIQDNFETIINKLISK